MPVSLLDTPRPTVVQRSNGRAAGGCFAPSTAIGNRHGVPATHWTTCAVSGSLDRGLVARLQTSSAASYLPAGARHGRSRHGTDGETGQGGATGCWSGAAVGRSRPLSAGLQERAEAVADATRRGRHDKPGTVHAPVQRVIAHLAPGSGQAFWWLTTPPPSWWPKPCAHQRPDGSQREHGHPIQARSFLCFQHARCAAPFIRRGQNWQNQAIKPRECWATGTPVTIDSRKRACGSRRDRARHAQSEFGVVRATGRKK